MALTALLVSGCGKKSETQQAMVNADSLSVSQADSLMAQPSNEVKKDTADNTATVANVVVNSDAAPLVEKASEAVSSPDIADDASVQKALKNLGFYSGPIDGSIGKKTKAAIKEFQRKNNLHPDGKVGPKTWGLLRKALETSSAPATTVNN